MSEQSEALLGLVGAYRDLTDVEQIQSAALLYGNPIICTPAVFKLAEAEGEPWEVKLMLELRDQGLIVVHDDPAARRAELASRPGYQNRASRRAARRGKPGKSK